VVLSQYSGFIVNGCEGYRTSGKQFHSSNYIECNRMTDPNCRRTASWH